MWPLIPLKNFLKLSSVMLSSEERGMVLSSPLKGVTNCARIPDALKLSVMLRYNFLPGLNSPVWKFYKHRTTSQIAHIFMDSQNVSPSPPLEHPLDLFILIQTSQNAETPFSSIISLLTSPPVLEHYSSYHLQCHKASKSFISADLWDCLYGFAGIFNQVLSLVHLRFFHQLN